MSNKPTDPDVPCPFCGGRMLLTVEVPPCGEKFVYLDGSRRWRMGCVSCDYRLMSRGTREAAIGHAQMRRLPEGVR